MFIVSFIKMVQESDTKVDILLDYKLCSHSLLKTITWEYNKVFLNYCIKNFSTVSRVHFSMIIGINIYIYTYIYNYY